MATPSAFAAINYSFNVQGVLLDDQARPVSGQATFIFDIYGGTCILYRESVIQTLGTDGLFSANLGSETSHGGRISPDPGNTMAQVFASSGQVSGKTANNSNCTYSVANAGEPRSLRVTATIGSTTVTFSPDQMINYVPMALVADTLQGKSANEFFQLKLDTVNNRKPATQTNIEKLLDSSVDASDNSNGFHHHDSRYLRSGPNNNDGATRQFVLDSVGSATAGLSDNSVSTVKIQNGAVTEAKIADSAVTNAKIASGIDAAKITTGTLDPSRIPELSTSKITSGTFDINRMPDLPASKITGSFPFSMISARPSTLSGYGITDALSNSTPVPVASGGTGANTLTSNGILYGSGTGAVQATAAGSNGQVLTVNASGVPTWGPIAVGITQLGLVTGQIGILYNDGSNNSVKVTPSGAPNQVLTVNASGVPVWGSISGSMITSGIDGAKITGSPVPVAYGGTGAGTFTPNGILYGNGAAQVLVTPSGTPGQVLTANASGVPTWNNNVTFGRVAAGVATAISSCNTTIEASNANFGSYSVDGNSTSDCNVPITGLLSGSSFSFAVAAQAQARKFVFSVTDSACTTFLYAGGGNTAITAGAAAVYTILRIGSTCYISMVDNLKP